MFTPFRQARNSLLIALGFFVTLGAVYGFTLRAAQRKLARQGVDISFAQLLRRDIKEKRLGVQEFIRDLPDLIRDTQQIHSAAHQIAANRLAQALELYYTTHGVYPAKLSELVPDYIKELPDPGQVRLDYTRAAGGYSLQATLPSGETVIRTP